VSVSFSVLFPTLPATLRDELVHTLKEIETNFKESRWEPSELNGGKLCEVVYSILKGHVDGNFPINASKPGNMVDACRGLEHAGTLFPRSVRIQIPRMLVALYEIRNNRGVGHVGGDVSPNHMDAVCVLHISKWVVSELLRVFHSVTTEEASNAVESLSSRELPLVWKINGTSRVLATGLSMLDKTLLLLYGESAGISEAELVRSIEHSNASTYRRDVLRKSHKSRILEYDSAIRWVTISPIGIARVEDYILR